MTRIPVSSQPTSTTPRSGEGTPRLPISPRAQKLLRMQRPKPTPLPKVSLTQGAVTPEAKSPRTEPASGSATPGSATPTERTPRDTPPWTPRQDRVSRSLSTGHRIEISTARRSASPKKSIRPALWSSGKESVAEVQPSAPENERLADSHKEQSPKFKVPEKRSPRRNTGIILGRSPRAMLQDQDLKVVLARSETVQPAAEKRDIVKERIRQFEERAQLADKVRVHQTNVKNRQPARRTRSEQSGSSIVPKPARRAPSQADAAEKPQLPSRKPENLF